MWHCCARTHRRPVSRDTLMAPSALPLGLEETLVCTSIFPSWFYQGLLQGVLNTNLRSTDWHCCASKLQKWSDFTFHDFSENVILLGMCVPFISLVWGGVKVKGKESEREQGKGSEREHTTVLISGNVLLISRKSQKYLCSKLLPGKLLPEQCNKN